MSKHYYCILSYKFIHLCIYLLFGYKIESLTLEKFQEKFASLNLKQYETKATMNKIINENEAKLREKEIDLVCHRETALTNNDESNLELNLRKDQSEDEG